MDPHLRMPGDEATLQRRGHYVHREPTIVSITDDHKQLSDVYSETTSSRYTRCIMRFYRSLLSRVSRPVLDCFFIGCAVLLCTALIALVICNTVLTADNLAAPLARSPSWGDRVSQSGGNGFCARLVLLARKLRQFFGGTRPSEDLVSGTAPPVGGPLSSFNVSDPMWLANESGIMSRQIMEYLVYLDEWMNAIQAKAPSSGLASLRRFFSDHEQRLSELFSEGSGERDIDEREGSVDGKVSPVGLRFFPALGLTPETETTQPFDDIQMLKYRLHMLNTAEAVRRATDEKLVAPRSKMDRLFNRTREMKRVLYRASSVFNRRYYYPLRRYEQIRPHNTESVAQTDAWYTALVLEAHCMYAASEQTAVSTTLGPTVTEQHYRPSLLRLPYLSETRRQAIMRHFMPEQLALMPTSDRLADTQTIFVSMASYRDEQCGPSLLDIMHKAKHAHRVYVGIAQQNNYSEFPCITQELFVPIPCYAEKIGMAAALSNRREASNSQLRHEEAAAKRVWTNFTTWGQTHLDDFGRSVCFIAEHVRLRRIHYMNAKGPTYGRYMAMLLYRGENLAMVVDSHSRFTPHWDTMLAHFYHKYEDEKTVLSHYPEAYETTPKFNFYRTSTAYLCDASFLPDMGYIRLKGIVVSNTQQFWRNNQYNVPFAPPTRQPITKANNFRLPQPWVAGGFLFSNASIMREVPFDPHLHYIFDGEEVLYSVRLWTHGYNIYSPERNPMFHFYERSTAPKVWSDVGNWYSGQQRCRQRVQYLLRSCAKGETRLLVPRGVNSPAAVVDASRYGMGPHRTVKEWYEYAGVDPMNYTVEKRWCAA